MKLIDVIADVRLMLQDTSTDSSLQRFSDATLLKFANQALKRMAVIRPDLFSLIGEIPCTAESVIQSMPSDSIRVMEIFQVKGGSSVRETNRETIDQTHPLWASDTAGETINWMRHVRNPNKFFVYPKAPSGQILIGEYAQTPPNYTADQDVELLPDVYYPVVIDGTIYLAESIDNEHVNSNRAAMFMQSFTQALTTSFQSRTVTDVESAGLTSKEVA